MSDPKPYVVSMPNDLLSKILRYGTLRIQKLFYKQSRESPLSVKWKYGAVRTKIAIISSQSCQMSSDRRLLMRFAEDEHRLLSFTRNYIYTDSKAFCTRTGQIVDHSTDDDGVTATMYYAKGFIVGWRDGSVWFPKSTRYNRRGGNQITVISSCDGRVFTGSEDGECIEWTANGEIRRTVLNCSVAIISLYSDPDGKSIAIGCANGNITMISLDDQKTVFTAHQKTAAFALVMNEQFLLSGHEDGRVRVWSRVSYKLKRVIQTGGVVTAISVFDDMLAIGTASGLLELYNWQTGEFVRAFANEHHRMITKVAIENDGELLMSASLDGQIISRHILQS